MSRKEKDSFTDGPASQLFKPVKFAGGMSLSRLLRAGVSPEMADNARRAPSGECVFCGIPFSIGKVLVIKDEPATVRVAPFKAGYVVFLHVSDTRPVAAKDGSFTKPVRGEVPLGERAADYVVVYEDGCRLRLPVRRRYEVGSVGGRWGEDCVNAVGAGKPISVKASSTQSNPDWGRNQTRVGFAHGGWAAWLWAWENPRPDKRIVSLRLEPVAGCVVLSGISAGQASSMPLRWRTRRKAMLALPRTAEFRGGFDESGLADEIQIDLGQIISVAPRPLYPVNNWRRTDAGMVPVMSAGEVLIEYASHEDAVFHVKGGKRVRVADLESRGADASLKAVPAATQRVTLKVIEKSSGKLAAVRLHVHGSAGEYLAPVDRHRTPNTAWFEDYSADFSHQGIHHSTYIPGRTVIDLPLGTVYVEVTKGFEIRPVRKAVRLTRATDEIVVEIEKVLPWREKGWVTADTHVHFLSPATALLEGAGEGVNVVNLLASQWGELMTNVGDFDGKTTHGSREAGGDGEYLVRVGTENRQRILGHISLLGYSGDIIVPMTTAGPDESAIGDPVEALLTEWAGQCKKQGGVVVVPHFPLPRLENAAAIVSGVVDAVEMSSRAFMYRGINPYALVDWYRYLNCGYMVAAVGGTDKMEAATAVGLMRTYAKIQDGREFTYEAWKEAVRAARTFVTCGPLMEFQVDGRSAGSRIGMSAAGGTVDVTWRVASVTMPMTRVELIVNGEVRESRSVRPFEDAGSSRLRVDRSAWIALLVRGRYRDMAEIVAAHSSPVMIEIEGSQFFAAADAMTILEQIEGALAFIDTIGTRAETRRYRQMRLVLIEAHRGLHNRMHQAGFYHQHTPVKDHPEHRSLGRTMK